MSLASERDRLQAAPARPGASGAARVLGAAAARLWALALAGIVAWLVFDLVFARWAVAAVLVLCAAAQLRWPSAWLLFLPALLPVADLGLWSGRLYVTEFDLLVLTIAAVHFWQAPALPEGAYRLGRGGAVLAILLVLAFLPGLVIGAFPLPPPGPGAFADYFSRYNALRVAKGFLWALLLLPALRRQLALDAAGAARIFVLGVALGLAATGLIVLWERGVFEAMVYGNRYAVLGALLDFSATYRATALFTELHTGGEAFDTYLVLAAALTTAGALALDRPPARLFCLGALGLGLYAVAVTFSRGLYAGYAAAAVLVVALLAVAAWRRERKWRRPILAAALAAPVSLAALAVAHRHGGYAALALGLALLGAGMGVAHALARRKLWATALAVGLLLPPAALLMARAFASSRYNPMDPAAAGPVALACCAALALSAAFLGGRGAGPAWRGPAAAGFLGFAALAGIGVPVVSGYFMTTRLAAAESDLAVRRAHWAEALRLMDAAAGDPGGMRPYYFGAGLASFPRLYFLAGEGPETKASYRYVRDKEGTWLEIGSGDFNITQKLPIAPDRRYEVSLDMRSFEAPPRLSVKLCPKLILFSDRWTPDCKEVLFRSDRVGAWVRQSAVVESGALGRRLPLSWPTTIQLHNESHRATLQVTNIRIAELGGASGNVVANGDFAQGGDRWIMISDFEHLGWHIKNLYLQLFFETGLLGAMAFLLCVVAGFTLATREGCRDQPIAAGFAGALLGFCVVGAVGSLLDNPRPAFLFFLVLFWSLHGRFSDVRPTAFRRPRARP